ncbi:flagellar biosynthesis protein FlhA [Paracoccus ravus]|uniref:flagellar biosynthesis protein FlhA n=1 Tax=Paracoccus ravus TaxID=2447760 RepID=UPI00106E7EFB|nr:flagellar biosynthesis protein FlhA [Paracoccus ravus]
MQKAKPTHSGFARLNRYLDLFSPFSGHSDLGFAAAVCTILAILFVPLPAMVLDIGLALSFAISILVLMVALWVKKPLEFDSFPSLLLVVTVMRLSLGIASTRLILSEGQNGTGAAGHVIEGIAYFVVGGDYVIGAIVFAILVAINFIVITKGSTRIAEVSARFSLDAMPGKQMAIDADLGAGLIDDAEARRRRKEVEGESSFFGAMDGAAKFVRGDAVAGIIITFVNILGGLLIGTLRHGMDFASAAQTYTVLTIGDGLVNQIPALIVSVAAGMIVTKGAREGTASTALTEQLAASPRALFASAALIAFMGVMPGFPLLLFWPIAAGIATIGLLTQRRIEAAEAKAATTQAGQSAQAQDPTQPEEAIRIDIIRLDLGASLVMMINGEDAALPGKVRSLRNLFAQDYGFILPAVRIVDASDLAAGAYRISVQGVAVASGTIVAGSRLLIDPAEQVTGIPGIRVKEPTFGLSALWIDSTRAAEAEALGHTVVDSESVIVTHLTEIIKEHMPDLLSYRAAQDLVNTLDRDYQKLVRDLPNPAPVILLQHVLQNLLAERVSIRNLPLIAEAMVEAAVVSKSPRVITEHVRRKLSASICATLEHDDGFLPVIVLGGGWEGEFANAIKVQGDETNCLMSPKRVQDFVLAARVEIQKFSAEDQWPAILVNPDFRPVIRSMLERVSPSTPVISHGEIHRKAKLRTIGKIGE